MKAREAYEKICSKYSERPVVAACREYDDYYGFSLAAPGSKGSRPLVGGLITLVNKNTGKISEAEYDEPYGYSSDKIWYPVDTEEFRDTKKFIDSYGHLRRG